MFSWSNSKTLQDIHDQNNVLNRVVLLNKFKGKLYVYLPGEPSRRILLTGSSS